MSATPADLLRQRATVLRNFASRLQRLDLLDLYGTAGPGTWVGPSPQACVDDLHARRSLLLQAIEDLQHDARRFERIAADLDAAPPIPGAR